MFERTILLREQGIELGLVSLLDGIAEPTERMGFLSGRGERLAEIRLEPARRFRAPNVNVHRREELSALADAVGDEAGEFDARCVGFE